MLFTAPDQILTLGARVERVARDLLSSPRYGPLIIHGTTADLPLAMLSAVVGNRLNTSLGIGAGLVAALPVAAAHAAATRVIVDECAGRIAHAAPESMGIEVVRAGGPDAATSTHAQSVSAEYHSQGGPRGTLLILLEEWDPLAVDYAWPTVVIHSTPAAAPLPCLMSGDAEGLFAMCNEEAIVAANILSLRCFRTRYARVTRRFGPELLYKVYGTS